MMQESEGSVLYRITYYPLPALCDERLFIFEKDFYMEVDLCSERGKSEYHPAAPYPGYSINPESV